MLVASVWGAAVVEDSIPYAQIRFHHIQRNMLVFIDSY